MSSGNISTKDVINNFGSKGFRRASEASSDSGRSPSSPTQFAGLMNQKRSSVDAGHTARKASWAEQSAPKGMIGKWWEGFTKGK